MKRLITWVILLSLSLLMLAPRAAFTQDAETGRITVIEEGEQAPFDGYLYDITAAAKLKAQLDAMDEACQITIDKSLAQQAIEHELSLEQLQIRYDNLDVVTQMRSSALNEIINLQERELERVNRPNAEFVFAGGVVAGIGLTVLSGWAIGQVAHGSGN